MLVMVQKNAQIINLKLNCNGNDRKLCECHCVIFLQKLKFEETK